MNSWFDSYHPGIASDQLVLSNETVSSYLERKSQIFYKDADFINKEKQKLMIEVKLKRTGKIEARD